MSPIFIQINGDIFNVNKIQALSYEDQLNSLGTESGVYFLNIYMENDIGSMHKAYDDKRKRNADFLKARDQLRAFSIKNVTEKLKTEQ